MKRFLLVMAASCSVLALGACGGSTAQPSSSETFELTDSSLVSGAYANPLDAIQYPEQKQQDIITQAIEDDIAQCMSDRGFTYVQGDGYGRWTNAVNAQYVYSVTDPKVAAVYGFHMESWVKRAQDIADGTAVSERPEGYVEALSGDPITEVKDDDGAVIAKYDPASCQGKALDANMPEWAMQARLIDLSAEIILEAAQPARESVSDFEVAWSECMAKEGFDYTDPFDANESFTGDLPTDDEIKTAVASANCQHSSGLLRAWSKARAEFTQKELDAYPGIVAEFNRIQNDAYANAQKASK